MRGGCRMGGLAERLSDMGVTLQADLRKRAKQGQQI